VLAGQVDEVHGPQVAQLLGGEEPQQVGLAPAWADHGQLRAREAVRRHGTGRRARRPDVVVQPMGTAQGRERLQPIVDLDPYRVTVLGLGP
jgi:hypothetical protein